MDMTQSTTSIHGRRLLVGLVCGLTLLWMVCADGARAQTGGSLTGQPGDGTDSASLVQCLTAPEPAERSATFSGEMTLVPGAAHMSMRIEVLERMPGETSYHAVVAPGLGVWRTADPGVKTYKYLKQVTNLSAPAVYRGLVGFRWQGPHGRVVKHDELRTSRCAQPAPAPTSPAPAPSASPPAASAPTAGA
jgi:hypothetical protein